MNWMEESLMSCLNVVRTNAWWTSKTQEAGCRFGDSASERFKNDNPVYVVIDSKTHKRNETTDWNGDSWVWEGDKIMKVSEDKNECVNYVNKYERSDDMMIVHYYGEMYMVG